MAQLLLELESARQEAQSARQDAENAQRETESARQQTESARQEAESARQETERMRQSEQLLRAEAQRAADRLREARKKEQQRRECGVCLDKERSVALAPCGHTFCGDCVDNLQRGTRAAQQQGRGLPGAAGAAQCCCPECREPVLGTLRVFM